MVHDSNSSHIDMAAITVTILNINNNAPVFVTQMINVTLSENVAVGTSVATFTASDAESNVDGQLR